MLALPLASSADSPAMPRRLLPTLEDENRPRLPAAVTSSLGFLAHQLGMEIRARFEAILRGHKLHPRHYLLLLVLRDEGPQGQQALGARVGLDRTTTMQAAQTLESAGLITRRDDPDDRRVYRLGLTPTGRRLVTQLEAGLRRAELEVLAPLTPEQRSDLHALLARAIAGRGESPSEC